MPCFFCPGLWVWSDGFPLERLSWVSLDLLLFLLLLTSFIRSSLSSFLSCCSCSVSVLLSAVGGLSFLCFHALASCWCSRRGGVRRGWLFMLRCLCLCLLLLALLKARQVLPCALHACLFSSCPGLLLVHLLVVVLVCFGARARVAMATPRS